MDAQVTDNAQRSRWEARLGDEVAGFLAYEHRDGEVALMHTVVDPAHEGQGVAGRLVQAAVDAAREQGTPVLPYCSYVRGWLGRHPEAVDLVPAERRGEFDL
jgi:hypothetical protein